MRLIKSTLFFVLATVQAWSYCSYFSQTGPVKSPLVATWQGDIGTVAKLLSSGIAVNALVPLDCHDGGKPSLTSPLLNAILAKDALRFHTDGQNLHGQAMVEFLLDHGADPSLLVQNFGPLHMAASLGDLDSIKALLQHGARVDDGNEGGETALLMPAQRAQPSSAPSDRGSGGYCLYSQVVGPVNSPLMIAIWQGDTQRVSKMIESEKDLNKTFSIACPGENADIKTTPLLNAIRGGHSEMVKLLLSHGANPLFRADPSWNPLLAAVSHGNIAIVRLLLQHGAIVDDRDDSGETPLMLAAQQPNTIAVINELIAAKADIHAVDKFGDNAVMLAAWQHRPEVVKFLVEFGVDGCAKNEDGETAIDQARSNLNEDPGKHEIIAFLQEKCGRQ